jgi:hypothetical protein
MATRARMLRMPVLNSFGEYWHLLKCFFLNIFGDLTNSPSIFATLAKLPFVKNALAVRIQGQIWVVKIKGFTIDFLVKNYLWLLHSSQYPEWSFCILKKVKFVDK